jgi:biopolymer transport protein ExbD
MVGSAGSSGNQPLTGINVTPLVDVMLVLLVIFMVTAKLDDKHGLPLDLPTAASGSDTQEILNVTLDAAGARFVNGTPMPDADSLRALAQRLHQQNPELRTVIAASTQASHGAVIEVLDTLRLAGIDKIAFAVEPKP